MVQDVNFAWFDGNGETEFIGFVDVIDDGVRNSHMRKVHIYETMIQKWHDRNRSHALIKDQILDILGRQKTH